MSASLDPVSPRSDSASCQAKGPLKKRSGISAATVLHRRRDDELSSSSASPSLCLSHVCAGLAWPSWPAPRLRMASMRRREIMAPDRRACSERSDVVHLGQRDAETGSASAFAEVVIVHPGCFGWGSSQVQQYIQTLVGDGDEGTASTSHATNAFR